MQQDQQQYVKDLVANNPADALSMAQNYADVHFNAQGLTVPTWLLILIQLLEQLLPLIPTANQQPKP